MKSTDKTQWENHMKSLGATEFKLGHIGAKKEKAIIAVNADLTMLGCWLPRFKQGIAGTPKAAT